MTKEYALLVDYRYCSGCQSCEVACKNEKMMLTEDEPWGIKVLHIGPWELKDGSWEYDFIPVPTQVCDLCIDRIKDGKRPACVHHCLAQCLEFGTVEEMSRLMAGKDGKAYVIQP